MEKFTIPKGIPYPYYDIDKVGNEWHGGGMGVG